MGSEMMGLINLQDSKTLPELNEHRPLATVPMGGKFRLIDFTLSNMVNAGIGNVGILLSSQSRSVLDHIRSGKEWGLARKRDGLFYLPADVEDIIHPVEGDIHSFYKNLLFVKRGHSPYILATSCDLVQNIDYEEVLHFHRRHNADVTMIYTQVPKGKEKEGYVLEINDKDRITGINSKAEIQAGDNLYQRQILIDTEIYQHCVRRAYAKGYKDFITDVLKRNVDRLRIFGYNYKGYVKRVDSIQSYFETNVDFLDVHTWRDIFLQNQRHIYTKIKDEAPAKYMEESHVTNSLVANGCIIEGKVENSILFRKVRVGKNAVIRNSIVMQHSVVGADANLDYVVCDKNAVIQPEAELSGTRETPLCIGKCSVI